MKVSKQTVKEILEAFGSSLDTKEISAPDDTIDFDKYGKHPKVIAMITTLKMLGVNGEWLRNKGFMAAYMLNARYLK